MKGWDKLTSFRKIVVATIVIPRTIVKSTNKHTRVSLSLIWCPIQFAECHIQEKKSSKSFNVPCRKQQAGNIHLSKKEINTSLKKRNANLFVGLFI